LSALVGWFDRQQLDLPALGAGLIVRGDNRRHLPISLLESSRQDEWWVPSVMTHSS
jgi:hypothetical protein